MAKKILKELKKKNDAPAAITELVSEDMKLKNEKSLARIKKMKEDIIIESEERKGGKDKRWLSKMDLKVKIINKEMMKGIVLLGEKRYPIKAPSDEAKKKLELAEATKAMAKGED